MIEPTSDRPYPMTRLLERLRDESPCRLDAQYAAEIAEFAYNLETQTYRSLEWMRDRMDRQDRLIASMAQASGWRA